MFSLFCTPSGTRTLDPLIKREKRLLRKCLVNNRLFYCLCSGARLEHAPEILGPNNSLFVVNKFYYSSLIFILFLAH